MLNAVRRHRDCQQLSKIHIVELSFMSSAVSRRCSICSQSCAIQAVLREWCCLGCQVLYHFVVLVQIIELYVMLSGSRLYWLPAR